MWEKRHDSELRMNCLWETVGSVQRFSKCVARPTGGAQRRDKWGSNARNEREIYFFTPDLWQCFPL